MISIRALRVRNSFCHVSTRNFASKPYEVFDRSVKLKQREKMAQLLSNTSKVEYLRNEVAKRTIERLSFIKRDFPKLMDLGSHSGNFARVLNEGDDEDTRLVRNKIGEILMVDSSKEMLHRWDDDPYNTELKVRKLVVDEEELNHKELEGNKFDGIVSNLSLHWINDLPTTLKKINNYLKPDGLFLGSMICEDSIFELRTSLQLAELERKNGMSMSRISPMIKVDDMTNLLKMAKFNMVTIDVEEIIVDYPDILAMMEDLQLMGENNANKQGFENLDRDVLISAQAIYSKFYGEADVSHLPLTFRVMFMIGWKESGNQPQPLQRGSGELNLKDVLG